MDIVRSRPRRSRRVLAAMFLLPPAGVALLKGAPQLDVHYQSLRFHVWVVSGIAALALLVALGATRSAFRSRQHGPVWLAIGCLCVSLFMVGHGLMTPFVHGRPMNMWIGRFPFLGILVFASCLVLAGLPRNMFTSRLVASSPGSALVIAATWFGGLVAFLHVRPTGLHGATPVAGERIASYACAAAAVVMLVLAGNTHWQRYRLGHDPVQRALVHATVLCSAAAVSLVFGKLWLLSWWLYHAFLLAAFGEAVYAIVLRSRRWLTSQRLLESAFDRDAMTHIVEGYPEALRSLVNAVELKDAYTAGHSRRTAIVAVQLGLRLGLEADILRAVAQGAYLHDVGKINVPDAILNKPGRLDPDERAVIERHPDSGYELILPVPELHQCLPAVRHQHERWDGTGYPARLAAMDIPLAARVVAIADVWDALTSDRSYRAGLAPAEALAHIVAGRGTHFDPKLVDAFVSLALDWGYRIGDDGDAETCWEAAQSCHEVALATNRA